MQKGKMVLKLCPKCEKQVPVACKACPCGHIYFHARKPGGGGKAAVSAVASDSGVANAVKRRRIEQVNQARATRGRLRNINPQVHRSHRSSTSTSNAEESDRLIEEHPKKRRARQKPSEKEEKAEIPEEDVFARMSPEKALRYSIVLAEINRKLCMSQNLQI